MNNIEWVKKINSINFAGLENIRCGDALYFIFETIQYDNTLLNDRIRICWRFIDTLFFSKNRFEYNKNSKILFLFSNSYGHRNDYKIWYKKVLSTCENYSQVVPEKRKFNLRGFLYIKYIYIWLNQCRKAGVGFRFSVFLCSVLYKAYIEYRSVINLLKKYNFKLLVTVCDTHLIDSMIVQTANMLNIDTATLQHGNFFGGWVLRGSYSKYFLAYGQFTRERCIAEGMADSKIKVLGMPHQIGEKYSNTIYLNNKKCIAVYLTGGQEIDDDIKMMNISIEFADIMGYEVIVKLHPDDKQSKYNFDKWNKIKKVYGSEISVIDFADKAFFSIVSGSTVYIELLAKLYPAFLYNGRCKIYNGISWNKFNNFDELLHLVDKYFFDKEIFKIKMLETRYYFLSDDEPSNAYKKFFKKFENM